MSAAGRMDPGILPIQATLNELEGEGSDARRGRGRFKREQKFSRRKVTWRSRGYEREANTCRLRQHKNRRRSQGMTTLMAAGHRTIAHAACTMVLTVHWRFLCSRLSRPSGLWIRVSVRQAHAAVTAGHAVRLPRRRPHGCPQHYHCQQAHPRPHFSRSDRNGPQSFHK